MFQGEKSMDDIEKQALSLLNKTDEKKMTCEQWCEILKKFKKHKGEQAPHPTIQIILQMGEKKQR